MFPAVQLRLRERAAQECQVVALAAAARKDDLVGAAIQQLGDAVAGIVQGASGATADAVDTGWITPVLQPVRSHGLEHPRIDGRGSRIVEVYRRWHSGVILLWR